MGRVDRIAEPWGSRTPYGPGEPWPVRVDSFLDEGLTEDDVDRWVPSATILHSNGDGLDIAVKDGRIAAVAPRYGLDLDPEPAGDPGLLQRVRQEVGDRLGRRSAPALLLLRDLRSVYMDASGVSVDWELLAQAAQGVRDRELLELASSCHPDTLRQARWANAQLEEKATQALVS